MDGQMGRRTAGRKDGKPGGRKEGEGSEGSLSEVKIPVTDSCVALELPPASVCVGSCDFLKAWRKEGRKKGRAF